MEIGGQIRRYLPLHADLLTPGGFSLDVVLFTPFVHKMTEGEAGESVWSSVNYLFFISISLI